jgi:hypothetical protein
MTISTATAYTLLRQAGRGFYTAKRAGSPLGGSSQLTVSLARTNMALVLPRAVRPSTSAIQEYASGLASPRGRHCRLTESAASTSVALIILRAVDLAWRLRSFVTNRHE